MKRARPLTFILRLWRRPGGWIAQLRELEGGRLRHFKGGEDLLRYLEEAVEATPIEEGQEHDL